MMPLNRDKNHEEEKTFLYVQGGVNSSKQLLFWLILGRTDRVAMLKTVHRFDFSADPLRSN